MKCQPIIGSRKCSTMPIQSDIKSEVHGAKELQSHTTEELLQAPWQQVEVLKSSKNVFSVSLQNLGEDLREIATGVSPKVHSKGAPKFAVSTRTHECRTRWGPYETFKMARCTISKICIEVDHYCARRGPNEQCTRLCTP